MFYLQTARLPVRITIGSNVLSVPKATRLQLAQLASEIVEKNTAQVTAGMDDVRRAEFRLFYQTFGVDVADIRRLIRTDEGATRLCRACLLNADVSVGPFWSAKGESRPRKTVAEVDAALEASGPGVRVSLAHVLADLDDSSLYNAPAQPAAEIGEAGADPLASSAPAASPA